MLPLSGKYFMFYAALTWQFYWISLKFLSDVYMDNITTDYTYLDTSLLPFCNMRILFKNEYYLCKTMALFAFECNHFMFQGNMNEWMDECNNCEYEAGMLIVHQISFSR